MTTTIDLIAEELPSLKTEMVPFAAQDGSEIAWWVQQYNRIYTGARMCTNEAFGNVGGDLGHIGRMSLPAPMPSDGESPPVLTAAAAVNFNPGGGAEDGDVTDVPATRYYRVAWADESTATTVVGGGDGSLDPRDARHISQQFPIGLFGGLSEAVAVNIGASDTVVVLSDINWAVPPDYKITHAYIFVSDVEDAPFYNFVGKMEYNAGAGTWATLYDTLGFDIVAERFMHPNTYLAMPSFEGACKWGSRIVGFTSSDAAISTRDHSVYFTVTNGSKAVVLADAAGDPLTSKAWPRWVEQGGADLVLDGSAQAYEIVYIDTDPTKRHIAYIATAYQGTTTSNAQGRAQGTNKLFIGMANLQVQEQVQAPFILDGSDNFGGPITAVRAEQRGDTLLVFTQTGTYSVRGLAAQESAQTLAVYTGVITPVSRTYGAVGATAVCDGPDGVFCLSASAVIFATSAGSQDLTNDLIREYIRTRPMPDKRKAVMAFDPTRNLLFTIIGDDCLVLDVNLGAWTIWDGGEWRYVCVVDGRKTGLTGAGGGSKVLFQDKNGDIQLLDENVLSDRMIPGATEGSGHYVSIIFAGTTFSFDFVPNPSLRRYSYMLAVTGGVSGHVGVMSFQDMSGTSSPFSAGMMSWTRPDGQAVALSTYDFVSASSVIMETAEAHGFEVGDFVLQLTTSGPATLLGVLAVESVPSSTTYEIDALVGATGTPQAITGTAEFNDQPGLFDILSIQPIRVRYQTGAISPAQKDSHRLVSTRVRYQESSPLADGIRQISWMTFHTFSGGEPDEVMEANPSFLLPETSSSTRTATLRQLRTSKAIGLPMSQTSRRVVYGLEYYQPITGRIRINAVEIITDEPEPPESRDGGR